MESTITRLQDQTALELAEFGTVSWYEGNVVEDGVLYTTAWVEANSTPFYENIEVAEDGRVREEGQKTWHDRVQGMVDAAYERASEQAYDRRYN